MAAYGRFAAYERFGRMLKRENMTVKAVRTTPHIYPESLWYHPYQEL